MVWLVMAALLACALLWVFFSDLLLSVDTIGLFNPIYMYLHYGKMTYPAYGFFHSMVVHPPTHYFAVALLMKVGIPFEYAIGVPAFLLMALASLIVLTGRFPDPVKVSLVCGFFIGAFQILAIDLRPDLDMALAWFAGLLALEAGRLSEWDSKRLFLGALLLTTASGIHYTGAFAWLGTLVYMAWCISDLKWRNAVKPVLSIIAGGCLFGIPYLALYVIPHWKEISSFLQATQATGGIPASIHSHLQAYKVLYTICVTPLYHAMFFPLIVGIPLLVIAFPILFWVRDLRGMALCSLPQLLFFLLFVQRKPAIPGYFLPEFMLYFCAIGIGLICALRYIETRFWQPSRLALPISAGVLLSVALWTTPWLQHTHLRPRLDELGIARAAGREILGTDAFVGARISRSYTNGGVYSYMIDRDLLWSNISTLNAKSYFDNFDAIAADTFLSDATGNEQKKSLLSWYVDGTLRLRGFFFENSGGYPTNLSYLLLSAKPAGFRGYELQGDHQVAEYEEQGGGDNVFVAAVCDSQFRLNAATEFTASFLLPQQEHELTQKRLLTLIVGKEGFQQLRPVLSGACSIQDERVMKKTLITAQTLLSTLKNDQNIIFYPTLDDFRTARYGPEAVVVTARDEWPTELRFLRGEHQGDKIVLTDELAKLLFRSDMNSQEGWSANVYGKQGGVSLSMPDSKNGHSGFEFYSGDSRDHLATRYFEIPPQKPRIFFSIWANPDQGTDAFDFALQGEQYHYLAHAAPMLRKPDGWILFVGWADVPNGKVRLVIQTQSGTKCLLDKALIVAVPMPAESGTVVKASSDSASRATRERSQSVSAR